MSLTSYLAAPSRDLYYALSDGGKLVRTREGCKLNLGDFLR